MRQNKKIEFYKVELVSDGMGGHEETPVKVSTIMAFTTPVMAEKALKDYGFVSTTSMKIITKEQVPEEFDYLVYKDKKYKVLQMSDFEKVRLLLVEVRD